ncbi:glucosaminidase domain-containing protein [Sphingomonas sp. CARO-RG-8B-R24-01]|uniref:glycoside hydrolase family 73 protein n=1 Tax=Sphingomonas sp. CARO-RG-8B-R24-01 TaxID=2914831 RepID=UPI001F575D27|nr:glucosaminidase domain-containing protein [Sphingomonas sp. CARO-RG-8B-R24-01]
MSQAKFAVAITADDKTAKGVSSAEKRIGAIPKHVSSVNRSQARQAQESIARSSRGMLRTLGSVEQASARVFGGRSVTSGFTTRLGALRDAASATGTGLGEAAAAGGALEGSLVGVGVVAGATVGVLAAAGYAAFKLADGWAKGAASIGRTADIIGVATKDMQEFAAASERMGVDKGTATGGLGGLSQTLNDARYGRNRDALAVLGKLGVKLQLNDGGTVDVGKMLPAIADAVAAQNSSGRRTATRALGMPEALIPVLSQGAKALSADMTDAGNTAYIATPGDIARGQRIQRKGSMVGQLADRAMAIAGSGAADLAEPGYDAVLSGGRQILSGATTFGGVVKNTFAPAAAAIERGGRFIERAAAGLTSAAVHAAQATQQRFGVPSSITLGQYGVESGYGRHMPRGSNNPFGIKARSGEPFVMARTQEQDRWGRSYSTMAKFRKFGSLEEAFSAHAQLLQGKRYAGARRALPSVDGYADALTGVYATDRHYGSKLKSIIHRNDLTKYDHPASSEIPVKVEVEMKGQWPSGMKAKATAGRGKRPAISHAFVG